MDSPPVWCLAALSLIAGCFADRSLEDEKSLKTVAVDHPEEDIHPSQSWPRSDSTTAPLDGAAIVSEREIGEAAPVDLGSRIETILLARTDDEAADACGDLFDVLPAESVRELTLHENVGIALRAAWEQVRRSVPAAVDWRRAEIVEPKQLGDFIAFATDRLDVTLPEWWKTSIFEAQAYERDNIFFQVDFANLYQEAGLGFMAFHDTFAVESDAHAVITRGNDSIAIPRDVFNKMRLIAKRKASNWGLSASLAPETAFVAIHDPRCISYPLFCLERKSGKIVWRASVWAAWPWGTEGYGYHFAEIITTAERVTVLGLGTEGAYVESFCIDDGKNVFRFSTER